MTKECSFPDCGRPVKSRGYCHTHWKNDKEGRELKPIREWTHHAQYECLAPNCDRKAVAKSYCFTHYWRLNHLGSIDDPPVKGWHLNKAGYVVEGGGNQKNMQHRRIMSEYLGRELLPHENVHHVNGDRADNRIENLELWNTSQPAGQRIEDKVAWAKELLALYEPTALR